MIKKVIGTFALSLLLAAQANAATLSITGDAEVAIGDSFTLEIRGDFESGLAAGGVQFTYDPGLVTLTSVELNLGVDPTLSCPGAGGCPADVAGTTAIIWGTFDTGGLFGPSTDVLMATLTFTASSAAEADTASFSMLDFTPFTGGWFDASFNLIDPPQLNGFSTTIVPLPAAVWFMIGGLGTLLGFRRK